MNRRQFLRNAAGVLLPAHLVAAPALSLRRKALDMAVRFVGSSMGLSAGYAFGTPSQQVAIFGANGAPRTNSEGSGGATNISTNAANVTTGNHLFVLLAGVDSFAAVNDTALNTYTPCTLKTYGAGTSGARCQWYYSLNVTGHPNNITTASSIQTANGSPGTMIQALQFSGSLTAFDTEQSGSNQGDTSCGNCGSITTSVANTLILIGIATTYFPTDGGAFNSGTVVTNSQGSRGTAAYRQPAAVLTGFQFNWSGATNAAHALSAVAFK